MGLLEKLKNLPERLSARIREQRDVAAVQKTEAVKRAFGREGAADVKEVVWTGHTVQTPEGKSYYPAVGLTTTGYYRSAEVQSYGGGEETWRWDARKHATKPEAMFAADLQSLVREEAPARKATVATPISTETKVISPDYFPNVWKSQGAQTPHGTLVAAVNIDPQEGRFYAGIQHFQKEGVAIRWAKTTYATKPEAVQSARRFANRSVRSMWKRDGQVKRAVAEHKEEVSLARGEVQESKVLQYRPRGPKMSR